MYFVEAQNEFYKIDKDIKKGDTTVFDMDSILFSSNIWGKNISEIENRFIQD